MISWHEKVTPEPPLGPVPSGKDQTDDGKQDFLLGLTQEQGSKYESQFMGPHKRKSENE